MKVLITGSHFTPAQSLIEQLRQIPDIKIVYVGRKYARGDDKALSVESKILPEMGIKFIPITAGKLNRFFSIGTIVSLLKTPVGFIQSYYYLLKEQPDLIISFGGFTGFPVVISGWLLSVPSILHEQSLTMGIANSLSSFFAKKIAVSFKEFNIPWFVNPAKIIVTGNPIRSEILELKSLPNKDIKDFAERAKRNSKPLILITAGNQGSHKINLIIEDSLSKLTSDFALIHQTGESKYDDYSNLKKYDSPSYLIKKWIEAEDFSYILNWADLVVSRGGMNSLMEFAVKGIPALMIPIPVGREQTENAKFFKKLGLGEIVAQKDITPELLIEKIKEIMKKKTQFKESAKKAGESIIMNADSRLLQEVLIELNSLK